MLITISGYSSQAYSQEKNTASAELVAGTQASSDNATVKLAASAGSGSNTKVNMSFVESVRLRILDYAALTGEYSIGSDQTLSLPGVGRVSIADLSPEDLEKELGRKISQHARRDLTVSLEITKFRPYYIVGMISRPGASEWQPGLNVVKAIALAGGTVRTPTPADDPIGALSLQQSRTQLQFSLALLARLKAEREGETKITASERMNSLIQKMPLSIQPRMREFITRQGAILDEQRKLQHGQVESLEREKQAAMNELHAAEAQAEAIKTQLNISQSLLSDVQQLKEKNLVPNSRYLTQRSDLITSQIRYAEAQSLTERARARVERVKSQIETLERQRKVALSERIESLQREVAQLEVSLLPSSSGTGSAARSLETQLTYRIARESVSGIRPIRATVFTRILPGDVIIVSSSDGPAPKSEIDSPAAEIQSAIESSSLAQRQSGRSSGGGTLSR